MQKESSESSKGSDKAASSSRKPSKPVSPSSPPPPPASIAELSELVQQNVEQLAQLKQEIPELVQQALKQFLSPAITTAFSATLTKSEKLRKNNPLTNAVRTCIKSVIENDATVLATIQAQVGATESEEETLTRDDTVDLARGECLSLVRGFSAVAQSREVAPPAKRRKRQRESQTWWVEDTQQLSRDLRQCVSAAVEEQVKEELKPLLEALVVYMNSVSLPSGSVAPSPLQYPQPDPYWSAQPLHQAPHYHSMAVQYQQPQQPMMPSQNFAPPGSSLGVQYYQPTMPPHVPATAAHPVGIQAATALLQVLRSLQD